jgi:hypothetical protein
MRLSIFDYGKMLIPWALPAGIAVLFLAERLPMVRRDLFCKLPLLGGHYEEYKNMDSD